MTRRLLSGRAVLTPERIEADSVLIEADKVVAIGRREDLVGSGVTVSYDGFIVPGMRDAHLHPSAVAAGANALDLRGVASFKTVLDLLRERSDETGAGEPIIGHNLDDELLGFLPSRRDLDAISRPILLYRVCSHIAVANTAALDLAHVGPSTPDPAGGSFDRDPEPTGVLRETAISGVADAVQALASGPTPGQLLGTIWSLLHRGITAVDAMVSAGTPLWCGGGNELFDLLAISTQIPIDVNVYVMTEDPTELEKAARLLAGASPGVRFGGWKGFADGSLGGHTAWLRSGYADLPASNGTPRLDSSRHATLARTAIGLGGVATIHAIGDGAVAGVLDLYSDLKDAPAGSLRIEHASVVDENLTDRLAQQGVLVSVQPQFAVSDSPWLVKRLGPRRTAWTYALDRMVDRGVEIRTGSDAPVEEPSPWATLAAAIERCRLHPTTALRSTAAGELREGGPADLAIIDRNPLESDPDAVGLTQVIAVWKNGQMAWSSGPPH